MTGYPGRWWLASLSDGDTHLGVWSGVTRSVHSRCGQEFQPVPLPFGGYFLPDAPPDPAQVCPQCQHGVTARLGSTLAGRGGQRPRRKSHDREQPHHLARSTTPGVDRPSRGDLYLITSADHIALVPAKTSPDGLYMDKADARQLAIAILMAADDIELPPDSIRYLPDSTAATT